MKKRWVLLFLIVTLGILVSVVSAEDQWMYVFYTVQPGDTLSGIAVRFGTNFRHIMQQNGLRTTLIFPGEILIIPTQNEELVHRAEEFYNPNQPYVIRIWRREIILIPEDGITYYFYWFERFYGYRYDRTRDLYVWGPPPEGTILERRTGIFPIRINPTVKWYNRNQ